MLRVSLDPLALGVTLQSVSQVAFALSQFQMLGSWSLAALARPGAPASPRSLAALRDRGAVLKPETTDVWGEVLVARRVCETRSPCQSPVARSVSEIGEQRKVDKLDLCMH